MENMQDVKMSPTTARNLYKTMPEMRPMLEDSFGKAFFTQSVEDRINTFDDALNETGRPTVPNFDCVPEDLRDFFKATYKCVVISEALNERKRFDIFNASEYRHYPWFRNAGSASAFGLSGTGYALTNSDAGSGSRLSFVDSKKAKIAGEKFKNEFRDMLSL